MRLTVGGISPASTLGPDSAFAFEIRGLDAARAAHRPLDGLERRFDIAPRRRGPRRRFHAGAGTHEQRVVERRGISVAEQHFEALFEMFRRLHGRDAYGGGTGTGLAIVRRLVERHDGLVWLESVPGSGTSFFFTLAARENGR